MNTRYRLFGGLLLLCVASLAFFGAGCGSSSKSNQPLDITSGTWSITITPSGGGGSGSLTATFTTFDCTETNIPLGTSIWTIPGPLSAATVCLKSSSLSTSTPDAGTPQGMIIGLGANPVPVNGTTSMVTNTSYFALEDTDSNSDAFDLTGTFTASSKSLSGTYTCDTSSMGTCSGKSGTFNGTMK